MSNTRSIPFIGGGKVGRAVDKVWLFFSSVKLTIVLLVLLAVAMSYGTYVETSLSNGAARILVYKTWWFDTLLALVALNLIGCTLRRAPYRPHQAGWIVTHIALLILMAGSVITHRLGIQGQMVLAEGDSDNVFYREELNRQTLETVDGDPLTLPFTVQAISFDQIPYPGISMTRMFRTRVRAWEPGSVDTVKHDIVLNHPLVMDGYKISQASFMELAGGGRATVLGVAYDPGIPWMYVGSILLVVGMIGIFFVKPYLKKRFPPRPVQRVAPLAEPTEMSAELDATKSTQVLSTAGGTKT